MSTRRMAGIFLLACVVISGTLVILTGCGRGVPQVNPTRGGPNGECVEFDGEPCDDDPFDTDDLFEKKKTSTPKPPVRKTPGPRVTVKARR